MVHKIVDGIVQVNSQNINTIDSFYKVLRFNINVGLQKMSQKQVESINKFIGDQCSDRIILQNFVDINLLKPVNQYQYIADKKDEEQIESYIQQKCQLLVEKNNMVFNELFFDQLYQLCQILMNNDKVIVYQVVDCLNLKMILKVGCELKGLKMKEVES